MRLVVAFILICLAIILGIWAFNAVDAQAEQIQGWHAAPAFPSEVHEHFTDDLADGSVVTAPRDVHVAVLGHNLTAADRLDYVRLDCESTTIAKVPVSGVAGAGLPEQDMGTYTLRLDPAKCPGVGREIRVHVNFETATGRKFSTTRTCVHTAGSGANYCGWSAGRPSTAGRHGGGYWDAVNTYSVAFVDGRDQYDVRHGPVAAGQSVRFKAQAGTLHVLLDPDIHHGSLGTELVTAPHGTWTPAVIPLGLVPGSQHKLVAIDERADHAAGVYVLPFTAA